MSQTEVRVMDEFAAAPAPAASAADELPVYIRAGAEFVFGVATRPVGVANGTAVLCLHAGNQNITSHRNATYTRLCRELAALGYLTLRMDFHGSGDSSGLLADRDVAGQISDDVEAAITWLLDQGAERVTIVGTCWGGRVALTTAARLEKVTSLALVSPALRGIEMGGPLKQVKQKHDALSTTTAGMLQLRVVKLIATDSRYRRWLLTRVRGRLRRSLRRKALPIAVAAVPADLAEQGLSRIFTPLVKRAVPIHILFGEHDLTYENLLKHGTLPRIKTIATDVLDITVKPTRIHGLVTLHAQDLIIEHVKRSLAIDRQGVSDLGADAPPS